MLHSLELIEKVRSGNKEVLRDHRWLQYLFLTKEKNVNLEQIESLEKIADNPVLRYVEKTLGILNENSTSNPDEEALIEEVLIWSDVAKCGLPHKREEWRECGFQLEIHNVGSAQIYAHEKMKTAFRSRQIQREDLVYILIQTHGLIGQFIRGEVRYCQFAPLMDWIHHYKEKAPVDIARVLYLLNKCIIKAVSPDIWKGVRGEVVKVISWIVDGKRDQEYAMDERIKKLRKGSIEKGEDFKSLYEKWFNREGMITMYNSFLRKTDMWYVETALHDFSFEEFLKIFLLIYQKANPLSLQQVSFEPFMKDIYYDYKGKKAVNLYKKRMIEAYLKDIPMEDMLRGDIPNNEHVSMEILPYDSLSEMVGVKFTYSKAGEKLIEFCQEAEKSPLYERSIILLYDFFGFRKDAFDRLQNEQTYLTDMNNGQDHKRVIADYAKGTVMVDIGAGGGVMLDVLSEHHPNAEVIGIDISTNVVEELAKKKVRENKGWFVKQADALELKSYYKPNSIDTIVFSSILHEMYSYIPYKGMKFNPDVVSQALKSSFEVLSPGGRIIIRDGIMTEPKEEMRLLVFHEERGMSFFKRYVHDFKGRIISYNQIDEKTIKLPVNDLMEFLYTYTWGEEAYPHEVQEQFGYFTPNEYKTVIQDTLGEEATIVTFQHYLQDGYEEFLLPKVKVMDESGNVTSMPDSTCFIVIEKYK